MPAALRGPARLAHAAFGALAGYGWRPQRLAAWTLVAWLAGALLFGLAEQAGALASLAGNAAEFHPLAHALDLLLPGIDLHEASLWAPVAGQPWGDAARLAGWALRLFGALVAALLIVSLAGWADRDRRR
jgi:hypothetical protein